MTVRLTRLADADIRSVLAETLRLFGAEQTRAYAALIEDALRAVSEDPARPSARDRPEFGLGVRSFRIDVVAKRRGAASHVLFFWRDPSRLEDAVIVLRLLHERMNPARRVRRARATIEDEEQR